MDPSVPDLIIFRERDMQADQQNTATPTQQPERQVKQQAESAPKKPQQPKAPTQQQDQGKLFCISHPWRRADRVCSKCGLPYCYADMMDYNGKPYCLQDIDSAPRAGGKQARISSINNFSIVSSALLFANSALLLYFMYAQIEFLGARLVDQGLRQFLLGLNVLYMIPMANAFVILLGFVAALTVLKNSISAFGFAFMFTFFSLFVMVYEFLSSGYLTYMAASSVLLLVAVAAIVYSRMAAFSEVAEEGMNVSSVYWPKPETF